MLGFKIDNNIIWMLMRCIDDDDLYFKFYYDTDIKMNYKSDSFTNHGVLTYDKESNTFKK